MAKIKRPIKGGRTQNTVSFFIQNGKVDDTFISEGKSVGNIKQIAINHERKISITSLLVNENYLKDKPKASKMVKITIVK